MIYMVWNYYYNNSYVISIKEWTIDAFSLFSLEKINKFKNASTHLFSTAKILSLQ